MKKLIACLMAIALLLSFAACGSETAEEKTYDQDFLKSMSKGLEARWALNDIDEAGIEAGSEEHKAYFEKAVNLELDQIGKYSDLKFSDTTLQSMALQYINLLNDSLDALQYMTTDYWKYADEWASIKTQRAQLIVDINSQYGLDIDEKYTDDFNEMITDGKEANEKDSIQKDVDAMMDAFELEKVSSEYGFDTYECVLENKTDVTFSSFGINIKYFDEDNIEIGTDVSYISDFEPGAKAKVSFMTDIDFDSYKVTADYYTD